LIALFKKLDIHPKWYNPLPDPRGGRIGCFESHIHVIQRAYDEHIPYLLVLEDDLQKMPVVDTMMTKYHTFAGALKHLVDLVFVQLPRRKKIEIEYLQLGYTLLPHEWIPYVKAQILSKDRTIVQYCGNTTHAYIVNRSGMKRILQSWKTACFQQDLHIDLYYKNIFRNISACVCPLWFDQQFCLSSDTGIPTSFYYQALRSFSCVEIRLKLFYRLSTIKKANPVVVIGCLLFSLVVVIVCCWKISATKIFYAPK